MAVAAEYRIPHSHFLRWSPDDRDKAIWWHVRKTTACPRCRTRAEEWDPGRGGRRDAYRAELDRCDGCVEIERSNAAPEAQGRGVFVRLVPNR